MRIPSLLLLGAFLPLCAQIPPPLPPQPMVDQAPVPRPPAGLDRTAPSAAESAEPPPAGRVDSNPATEVHVALGEKRVRLDSVPGTTGRTWAYWVTLFWADFPGMKAELRLQDPLPIFYVTMAQTPRHRLFLVKCRVNKGDRNRSVKMGHTNALTYKGLQAPDPDWVVPVEVKEERPGLWRVMPLQRLEPGEYGLFSGAAAAHATKGSPAGELFEFAIDKP